MTLKFSDKEISDMVKEYKPLPEDFRTRIKLRDKRGHKERDLDVKGIDGNFYRIILRQSNFNKLKFSIILAVCPKETNLIFWLRRFNGKSHEHTNHIEKEKFYDFHIHRATERYQEIGMDEDSYAEPTDRFSDYNTALQFMLEDCGFDVQKDEKSTQKNLFEEI